MKSLKKVLALTSVVAMLGSYAAGAASVTIANKDDAGYIGNVASGNIAVDYTYTPDAGTTGNQVTIIAFEDNGEVALDKEVPFTEGFDVAYINQIASDDVAEGETTVDGNFTFAMRNGLVADLANGEYFNVFVGGTNVAVADRATFSYGTIVEEEESTTYSISGTIANSVYFGDDADLAEINEMYAPYAIVYDEYFENEIDTVTVSFDVSNIAEVIGDATITVEGLEKGVGYNLMIGRLGACPIIVTVLDTVEADVEFGAAFAEADINEDGYITGNDADAIIVAALENSEDMIYDVNIDGFVTGNDADLVVSNALVFDETTYNKVIE